MDPKAYLHSQIAEDETIIWEGRPLKKAIVLQAVFGRLPICVIWLLYATILIGVFSRNGMLHSMFFFIVPFLAIWLAPVWIWLANIFFAWVAYQKTYYMVTNSRILLMHGSIVSWEFENLYYQNIGDIHLAMRVVDNICNTGTIVLNVSGHETNIHTISNIENAITVFQKMQKCISDIASDVYYPNDMRPTENHGYRTEYKG